MGFGPAAPQQSAAHHASIARERKEKVPNHRGWDRIGRNWGENRTVWGRGLCRRWSMPVGRAYTVATSDITSDYRQLAGQAVRKQPPQAGISLDKYPGSHTGCSG